MPPQILDVVDRRNQGSEEVVFVKGKLPYLGHPHDGWSGDETIIFRRKMSDGSWKIINKELQEYKKAADPHYKGKQF